MKLTDPESIKENEKEFIDTINAELDWEAIEKMLMEQHKFTLQDEVDYKDGDLIVHKDQIAYKLDFEIKVPLSLIFNRSGECLEMVTIRPQEPEEPHPGQGSESSEGNLQTQKVEQMASDIADMIHEINQGDE